VSYISSVENIKKNEKIIFPCTSETGEPSNWPWMGTSSHKKGRRKAKQHLVAPGILV